MYIRVSGIYITDVGINYKSIMCIITGQESMLSQCIYSDVSFLPRYTHTEIKSYWGECTYLKIDYLFTVSHSC